jgi:hypothetical protein
MLSEDLVRYIALCIVAIMTIWVGHGTSVRIGGGL